MGRPEEFRRSFTVVETLPYEVQDGTKIGAHASKGVLEVGRVVWLSDRHEAAGEDIFVSAFAEGIGVVLLDSRSLKMF